MQIFSPFFVSLVNINKSLLKLQHVLNDEKQEKIMYKSEKINDFFLCVDFLKYFLAYILQYTWYGLFKKIIRFAACTEPIKHQNISPKSAVIFEGFIVPWAEK